MDDGASSVLPALPENGENQEQARDDVERQGVENGSERCPAILDGELNHDRDDAGDEPRGEKSCAADIDELALLANGFGIVVPPAVPEQLGSYHGS